MAEVKHDVLLAVGSLVASISGGAQTPTSEAPQATVRELATIDGNVRGFLRLPNGRVLLYSVDDTTFAYDIVTKRRTRLGTGMNLEHVSPQGDRLAFSRSSEDHKGIFLWTMPIDPNTGVGAGQAKRVSLEGDGFIRPWARFSPDGKTLAYNAGPQPDGAFNVTLVPATGGAERVVANYPTRVRPSWSADGRWLYVERYGSGRLPDRHAAYIERVPAAGGRSEVLFPVHTTLKDWFENVVGVSPDGRVAFYMRNPDQVFYMTASGATGEITVPLRGEQPTNRGRIPGSARHASRPCGRPAPRARRTATSPVRATPRAIRSPAILDAAIKRASATMVTMPTSNPIGMRRPSGLKGIRTSAARYSGYAVIGADTFAEVSQVRTMDQVVAEILYSRRLAAAMLVAGGVIGLVLSCIGLYGVVSYSLAQRLREIGIRATLGADRRDIVLLVLREGARVPESLEGIS